MTIEKQYLPLFRGIDMTLRKIPVLSADSGLNGPVVVLTGAIHGDEVTGTAVIQSVFKLFEKHPLQKGTVIAYPILNPTGFEAISRHEQYGAKDLNRNFPGDPNGSTAQRHAHTIAQAILVARPDYVIDLHTDSMNSIPYTILDRVSRGYTDRVLEECTKLARMLGFHWAIDTDRSAGYDLQSSLSGFFVSSGIPAVTVELGGPLVVNEQFRKIGLDAVWGVLHCLSMTEKSEYQGSVSIQDNPLYFYERMRTESTGIIDYRVKPGQTIKKDTLMAKIRNAFGETIEVIRAHADCIVFSHEDQSVTFPGLELFTLAGTTPPLEKSGPQGQLKASRY